MVATNSVLAGLLQFITTEFRDLFLQSGQCLKILDFNLSYINHHKKYLKATQKLFALYQTAINYCEAMRKEKRIEL
jgi:hypothetical protein